MDVTYVKNSCYDCDFRNICTILDKTTNLQNNIENYAGDRVKIDIRCSYYHQEKRG